MVVVVVEIHVFQVKRSPKFKKQKVARPQHISDIVFKLIKYIKTDDCDSNAGQF